MDDLRQQKAWEVNKDWLKDKTRSDQALACIEHLTLQTLFVRRRGQLSGTHYFETTEDKTHNLTHARAAIDLAGSLSRRVAEVMNAIPVAALLASLGGTKVAIPALAFLPEVDDFEPLRFEAQLTSGEPLPEWLQLDSELGVLSIVTEPSLTADVPLKVTLMDFQGACAKATCVILSGPSDPIPLWIMATGTLMARFSDASSCPLNRIVRNVLSERLADIYNFEKQQARQVSLHMWLKTVATVIRMLRSSAIAHIIR